MELSRENVIGIVGGMGPQAGIALLNDITALTIAEQDQQHLSTMLMSFPKHIVDRSLYLEGKEVVNPAVNIATVIRKLEDAGADIVGIACNTSHAPLIYDQVLNELAVAGSQVNLLHMPQETCKYIQSSYPDVGRVGVMSTNGTYKSKIYSHMLSTRGYEVILPDEKFQNDVIHKLIYDEKIGIKANTSLITGEAYSLLDRALHFFYQKGAEAIILGCTELSLILHENEINGMYVVDSNRVLARALVKAASASEVSENDKLLTLAK